jgi:lipopolysaccharide transport system ATP-binding protein
VAHIAVKTEALGKQYRLGTFAPLRYGRLTETLSDAALASFGRGRRSSAERRARDQFWALRDVSFEVAEGDVVGVIGPNGAGKTTLLKILSRITRPSAGQAELRGRVGSLLEVGTGFHQELTGRENVYLNGAILGMGRAEVRRKFDEIVAFSEVERFLDTPVKRYSSGMAVRLAFAVAAHLEPEILIVDEVLAVGDAAFQRKCLGKMESVGREGRTVLFVSHNMAAVTHLCDWALQLEAGRILRSGRTDEVVHAYLQEASGEGRLSVSDRTDRRGGGQLRIRAITLRREDGAELGALHLGQPAAIELEYDSPSVSPLRNVAVSLALDSLFGQRVTTLQNEAAGQSFDELPPRGVIVCELPRVPVLPGAYQLTFYVTVNGVQADWLINAGTIEVTEGDYFGTGKVPQSQDGLVVFDQRWRARPAAGD